MSCVHECWSGDDLYNKSSVWTVKIIFELILLCKQMKILSLIIYPHVVPSL